MTKTPKQLAIDDALARLVQKKRLERSHDAYQTALARETLESEQLGKDIATLKEQLQRMASSQGGDRSQQAGLSALRKRAKLERRVSGFEEKINELDTYIQKLAATINALRK